MSKKNFKAKLAFLFSPFRNAFAFPTIDGIEINDEDIMNQLVYKKTIDRSAFSTTV